MKPLSRTSLRLLPVLSLSLTVSTFGAASTEPTSTQAVSSPVTSAEQSLSTKLPEFTVDHEALDHVLPRLAKAANIKIDAQWDDIAAAGISQSTPVDIRMRGVDTKRVLFFVLGAAAESNNVSDALKKPDFEITDDGNILIDTREQLCLKHASQHRYDLAPVIKMAHVDEAKFMKSTAKAVEDIVDSSSWARNLCGPPKVDGTALVITQTDQNQRATAAYLEQVAKNYSDPSRPRWSRVTCVKLTQLSTSLVREITSRCCGRTRVAAVVSCSLNDPRRVALSATDRHPLSA